MCPPARCTRGGSISTDSAGLSPGERWLRTRISLKPVAWINPSRAPLSCTPRRRRSAKVRLSQSSGRLSCPAGTAAASIWRTVDTISYRWLPIRGQSIRFTDLLRKQRDHLRSQVRGERLREIRRLHGQQLVIARGPSRGPDVTEGRHLDLDAGALIILDAGDLKL